MQISRNTVSCFAFAAFVFGIATGSLAVVIADRTANAAAPAPTEHKGLGVEALGQVSAKSMQATLGLEGHKLQLRAISIAPGGQIAVHSHENRPGLVKVVDGEWVEGRQSGEATYSADQRVAIIEDENTVHWFFNRGDRPATALVCDIVPE